MKKKKNNNEKVIQKVISDTKNIIEKISEYYIIRYNDVYEDNRIWEIKYDEADIPKELDKINKFNDIKEIWVEHVKLTETKEIEKIKHIHKQNI